METQWIDFDSRRGYQKEELEHAAAVLRGGGLVAFPTETVYGLGGDGMQPEAAKKIYQAKGRPADNPLILHISSTEELSAIVEEIPEKAQALMDAFWPGPMTLVFKKSGEVPYETTGGLDTVAVRMPEHRGARELIACAGVPVAAPSANRSGRPSPTTAQHVKEDLWGRIDLIIDGGAVGIGVESTIIDVTEEIPLILRPGHITKKMIEAVIGEVRMDPGLTGEDPDQRPRAPGMKYRHYAPRAPMTVIQGSAEAVICRIRRLAAEYPSDRVGILSSDESAGAYKHGQVISIGSRERHTLEQGLYSALREFDNRGVEVIFSESFSEDERGEAVMNRLLKAAGQRIEYVPGE